MPKPRRELCHGWADGTCICAQKWEFYQSAPLDAFEEAGPILAAMLACVSSRCPDAKVRTHATVQLMHPVFSPYSGRVH